MDKRRVGTAIARYSVNPLVKALAAIGPLPLGMALLETVGRTSGEPRRVPVGGRLRNGAFWFVAEHGRRAAYVRNIVANPRVRVKVGRRWLAGTAVLLDEDDAVQRAPKLGLWLNGASVRMIGTEPLSVCIDLDPDRSPGPAGLAYGASLAPRGTHSGATMTSGPAPSRTPK